METCETCGSPVEYIDLEWAKYNFSDDEELVQVYECTNPECKNRFHVRNRKEIHRI